ncbi:MAG: N-formylglutamate amidohydrolase [Halobacteriovoraceae bacterium]|nr:N-formylglutamate amidohydrolase [Halobacteriovoraceae bacterium]
MEKPEIFQFYPAHGKFRHSPKAIVSIPHSGEHIPEEFRPYLKGKREDLFCDVDYKVNECVDIAKLQESGICVIAAQICRVAVDLNRSQDQFLFFWKTNTQGKEIVVKSPDPEFYDYCYKTYYRPYFFFIEQLIENHPEGSIPFIDLHSMPSKPTAYHMKQNPKQSPERRPDFCISDRHGLTCPPEFIDNIAGLLNGQSYKVNKNNPYIGGYITEHFAKFEGPNIQIEINRDLYMDEIKIETIPEKIEKLSQDLTTSLINFLASS